MNRRLHNTYTAMLITGVALALGLMLATPARQQPRADAIPLQLGALDFSYIPDQAGVDPAERTQALTRSIERRADNVEGLADAAALAAEIATAAALAGSLKELDADASHESPRSANKPRHRSRQTLAMPYFSFAPRG